MEDLKAIDEDIEKLRKQIEERDKIISALREAAEEKDKKLEDLIMEYTKMKNNDYGNKLVSVNHHYYYDCLRIKKIIQRLFVCFLMVGFGIDNRLNESSW